MVRRTTAQYMIAYEDEVTGLATDSTVSLILGDVDLYPLYSEAREI